MKLSIVEVTDRGLKDFGSLAPLEKDVFVVNDLELYFEMEGSFEDYILGEHQSEVSWLQSTLRRIGDTESEKIIASLCSMSWKQREEMYPLCVQFYELREKRWQFVASYLQSAEAELVE